MQTVTKRTIRPPRNSYKGISLRRRRTRMERIAFKQENMQQDLLGAIGAWATRKWDDVTDYFGTPDTGAGGGRRLDPVAPPVPIPPSAPDYYPNPGNESDRGSLAIDGKTYSGKKIDDLNSKRVVFDPATGKEYKNSGAGYFYRELGPNPDGTMRIETLVLEKDTGLVRYKIRDVGIAENGGIDLSRGKIISSGKYDAQGKLVSKTSVPSNPKIFDPLIKEIDYSTRPDLANNPLYHSESGVAYPVAKGTKWWIPKGGGYLDPRANHPAADISVPEGTPVLSTIEGTVVLRTLVANPKTVGMGTNVIVKRSDGTYIRIGHMSDVTVKEGSQISIGQQLGLSGQTGAPGAPHMHYEVVRGTPQSRWQDYWGNNRKSHVNPFTYVIPGR